MSLESNIILTGIISGLIMFGFYQAGKHKVFEKWLERNDKKTN